MFKTGGGELEDGSIWGGPIISLALVHTPALIVTVSFIDGGNQSTWGKLLTMVNEL